ncbi:MAG: SGNH/GDSL hydrolase family protein [Succiniclasticum sp.]|nr:SGNH/GDSL hydrolase family protein [Succiniclasticum sp.]
MKITITADGRKLSATTNGQPLTSGSVGIEAAFVLSADYDGLAVTAVFSAGETQIDVVLTNLTCIVPWEVLQEAKTTLYVGIVGKNGSGEIVIPTVWGRVGMIECGTVADGLDPEDPTPDIAAQILEQARAALAEAAETKEAAAQSAQDAADDADRAEAAKQAAETAQGAAETAQTAAEAARDAAASSATDAAGSATTATQQAQAAATARAAAEAAQQAAETAQGAAETAQAAAEAARDAAASSATAAAGSAATATQQAQAAATAKAAAETAQTAAETAQGAAETAQTAAEAARDAAASSATDAAGSATTATQQAQAAATARSAAEAAQQAAETAKNYAQTFTGAPRVAASAAQMTDTDLIYVYTGTTSGTLTTGHWYYWDGSAWTDGGVYNSSAVQTDTTLTVSGAPADAKATGDAVDDLKSAIAEIATIPQNVNLFDKNNLNSYTIGEAININNGSTESYANMCTTDYIRVDKDVQYSFLGAVAYYGTTHVCKIPIYKDDLTLLTWCQGTLDSTTNAVTFTVTNSYISTENCLIRLSFRKADIGVFMFVEGEYPEEYIPYEHPTLNPNIDITGVKTLNGKSIALNGDSICAGGGDAVGGYGLIISENENMVYQNIAVAGGTITYVSGRHCISRTMQNMYHYDYVIFEGGINDKALSVPFGTISDGYTATLDDTTFCGAFEQCCKTLCENYSSSKYGYIFVHRIGTAPDWYTDYRPAMKEILNKWGIPFIDLQELAPPLNFIDSLKAIYTNNGDGWHPNKLGYETFYVSKITAWLLTL